MMKMELRTVDDETISLCGNVGGSCTLLNHILAYVKLD